MAIAVRADDIAGDDLALQRRIADVSQAAVAEQMRVSRQRVTMIEARERVPAALAQRYVDAVASAALARRRR
jgi:DNA-binding transcriptional regulator YiaG